MAFCLDVITEGIQFPPPPKGLFRRMLLLAQPSHLDKTKGYFTETFQFVMDQVREIFTQGPNKALERQLSWEDLKIENIVAPVSRRN